MYAQTVFQKMDKLSKKMDNFLNISVKIVLSINDAIYHWQT
jgi:hypothetical protein